jgi:uncharacterized protein (DUF433 family)
MIPSPGNEKYDETAHSDAGNTTMQLALKSELPPLQEDAHGVIRIGQTRATLESVIGLFEQGASAEEIALRFDVLDLHTVYATLTYYLSHRQEVQDYMHRQRQSSARARHEAALRSPPDQVRARIAQREKTTDVAPAR